MKLAFNSLLGRTQQLTEGIRHFVSERLSTTDAGRVCAEIASALASHLPANDEGAPSERSSSALSTALWRAAGLRLGERASIAGALHIWGDRPWREYLTVGADTRVNGSLSVEVCAPVEIGEGVSIGQDVSVRTLDDHGLALHVKIGDGSSLGAGCTVMPGVSIGKGATVVAGAVVTDDVAEGTTVAGAPARVVTSFEEGPQSGVVKHDEANPDTARSPVLRAAS
jgi:carbonic anhydrase/acetyltransferase-like protein (isoleucine patch superfamily)